MNKKTSVLGVLIVLSVLFFMQASVAYAGKPTSVTFETSSLTIDDVVLIPIDTGSIIQYHYSGTVVGVFQGTFTWIGEATSITEKSIKDEGYFAISTQAGRIVLHIFVTYVWDSDAETYVQEKGSWTIVSGTGAMAAVSGRGTVIRDISAVTSFEGKIA